MEVRITDDELVVALADGRTLSVPLVWYPRLLLATADQRNDWHLIGDGEGIHWPQIDEDLSAAGLLRGIPDSGARLYHPPAKEIEGTMGQAAQAQGGQGMMGQASQAQGAAGQLADQAQQSAGQVFDQMIDQAGQAGGQATLAALRRAEELGVDLSQIEGTGAGGLITAKDVEREGHR